MAYEFSVFVDDVRRGMYPIFKEHRHMYEVFRTVVDSNKRIITIMTMSRPCDIEHWMFRYDIKGVSVVKIPSKSIYDTEYLVTITRETFLNNLKKFYGLSVSTIKEKYDPKEKFKLRQLGILEKMMRKMGKPGDPYRIILYKKGDLYTNSLESTKKVITEERRKLQKALLDGTPPKNKKKNPAAGDNNEDNKTETPTLCRFNRWFNTQRN